MKRFSQIFTFAFVLLAFTLSISAQKATRLTFGKGAISVVADGFLRGYGDKKIFVIRVRRGQTMRAVQIKSESSTRYVTVAVKNPRGEDAGDADASCNSRREIAPTVPGDYLIEVVECRKADRWRGSFKVKITVD